MVMQYIEQQNEVIRFLRERIKSFEDNAEDSISREREVCPRVSSNAAVSLTPTPIARTRGNNRKPNPGACAGQLGLVPSPKPATEQQRNHLEVSPAGSEPGGGAERLAREAAQNGCWPIREDIVLKDRLFFMTPFSFLFMLH